MAEGAEDVEEADLEAEEMVMVVVLEAKGATPVEAEEVAMVATPVESVVRLAPKEAQAFLV